MLLGGTFSVKINGVLQSAKGQFTYNLGAPKHEAVLASNGTVAGFKRIPMTPFIDGEFTDSRDFDVKALTEISGAEITLELLNGKVVILSGAIWASDGTINTEEGAIPVRFEGLSAEEFSV